MCTLNVEDPRLVGAVKRQLDWSYVVNRAAGKYRNKNSNVERRPNRKIQKHNAANQLTNRKFQKP